MKKLYFVLLLIAGFVQATFAQQAYVKAPAFSNTTTTTRAVNGTTAHAAFKGCFLLTASELSVVATNSAINSIGFYLTQGSSPAVTGNIQIYLQNTNNLTYQKGNSYSTAIAPMTSVYNSTMTIPSGASNTITLPLPTNFAYTGGGLYVAFEWTSTGPFGSSAIYAADGTTVAMSSCSSATVAPSPDAMIPNGIRPLFQVGYINTYTNEAQVYGILGNGRQPLLNGQPYTFSVIVRNNAGVTMNNIVPTLSITGANNFVATTTISSLAPDATVTATFPAFSATVQGMNTVNVSIPADENNANNSMSVQHSVTCNYLSTSPPLPISSYNQGVGINGGLLLNRISVPNASTLTALRLGIPSFSQNPGNSVYGVVTNSNGVILATTNTVVITNAISNSYNTFSFATPVTINPSTDYFIGMAQPANTLTTYYPMASMPGPTNNIPSNLQATSFLGGGIIFPQTPTLGVFAIEAVFYNTITLTVAPLSSTICSGNTVSITASGATSYSWSNGASTSSISVTPGVFTAYTCTGSAIVGTVGTCEDIKTVPITVNLTPTITCPNGAICPTPGSFTLAPSGAATYTYSGAGPIVSPSVTTSYTVTGTSAAGCPAANTVVTTVSVAPSITVSIAGPSTVCVGSTGSFTASGAQTYSWSIPTSNTVIVVSPTAAAVYSVTGTFGSCTSTAQVNVAVSATPTLSIISSDPTLCIGHTATLNAIGAASYSWSTGGAGLTATVSPTVNTTYTLVGTVGICSQTTTITQEVDPCAGVAEHTGELSGISIYPNPGTGVFTVKTSMITENSAIRVFNSLGELLLTEKLSETSHELHLSALSKGLYFVKLSENGKAVRTARLIIQ